jgi:hypothetical protein
MNTEEPVYSKNITGSSCRAYFCDKTGPDFMHPT